MMMTPGITDAASSGVENVTWHILGQIYVPKQLSENSLSWHATFPKGTFVPPHTHTTQDEFVYVLEGALQFWLDGKELRATSGGLARLPMGIPHGIFNKSGKTVTCLFWVSPTRKLFDLFQKIHNVPDPNEVVRLAALHEVNFLPPPKQLAILGDLDVNIYVNEARRPLIVGIGGTQRADSSSELAARFALRRVALSDMRVQMFDGVALTLPLYNPSDVVRDERATLLIRALREADGIILAAPAYHGCISGLIKNALDYTEDMKGDRRAYFDGRAIGAISCAGGWQAAGTTLAALRSVVHSLRGWNTPMGVMINTASKMFDGEKCLDADVERNIGIMVEQVVEFARRTALQRSAYSS